MIQSSLRPASHPFHVTQLNGNLLPLDILIPSTVQEVSRLLLYVHPVTRSIQGGCCRHTDPPSPPRLLVHAFLRLPRSTRSILSLCFNKERWMRDPLLLTQNPTTACPHLCSTRNTFCSIFDVTRFDGDGMVSFFLRSAPLDCATIENVPGTSVGGRFRERGVRIGLASTRWAVPIPG